MSDVTIKAATNAALPFTASISGHDAQDVPWTRSYTFTSLATSYTVDEVEAQQLADVYTRSSSGDSVPAVRVDTDVVVTGAGTLVASLQGTAAAQGVVTGGAALTATLQGIAAGTVEGVDSPVLPVLETMTKVFEDLCDDADPIATEKWRTCDAENVFGAPGGCDGDNRSLEFSLGDDMGDVVPGRFAQSDTGGPDDDGMYTFSAVKSTSAVYACPPRGRAAIAYPVWDNPAAPGGQAGPPGAGYWYDGDRAVFLMSTKLDPSWDPNVSEAGGVMVWRLLAQWKQNEWITVTQDSPQLSFEQYFDQYLITANDDSDVDQIVWSLDTSDVIAAAGSLYTWVRWAFDINFSDSGGSIQVHADLDNDGEYEYDSGLLTGFDTLCPAEQRVTGPAGAVEASWSPGVYEGEGGDTASFSGFQVWMP